MAASVVAVFDAAVGVNRGVFPALSEVPAASRAEAWPDDPALALEALMGAYGQMILRLAYFYVRDRQWAEDICQEAFLRAFRGWVSFRRDSSARTWLSRIAVNLCLEQLRRPRWREEVRPDPAWPEPAGTDHPADPEEAALDRLDRRALLGHVLNLSEDLREAIFLYYYFDLATPEIAQVLGCPEGTVRSRLTRARQHLRAALEREGWRRD